MSKIVACPMPIIDFGSYNLSNFPVNLDLMESIEIDEGTTGEPENDKSYKINFLMNSRVVTWDFKTETYRDKVYEELMKVFQVHFTVEGTDDLPTN